MIRKPRTLETAIPEALAKSRLSRRDVLRMGAMGALVAGTGGSLLHAPITRASLKTHARVVIVGAGAAGVASASRLARELDGADITIIDPREEHFYQPGLTLVGSGIWQVEKTIDRNQNYLPSSVNWIRDLVTEYDPDNNRVITSDGRIVNYDFLLVACGLQINYSAIDGMSPGLIGQQGVGCVYDNPSHAQRTWKLIDEFTTKGGIGLFTRAPGAIKCAGAPLKMTMLTESRIKERGNRHKAEFHYLTPGTGLFSQPDTEDFLLKNFRERDIRIHWDHRLAAIDPDARTASFATPLGTEVLEYDFIHVVPPMSAPDSLRNSALAAPPGPFAGWLEVDRHTLQHVRYPNVFGAGDINGVPIGKTAASVKAQVPVAVHNMIQTLQGLDPTARYDGYTSCPMITELGKAILVEFDYELKMTPSFAFVSPYEEHWVGWVMKDRLLLAAYRAMLHGRI